MSNRRKNLRASLTKMPDYEKMKVSDMRKMLKEHRKTHVAPVSKMSKIALMKELDRYAGSPSGAAPSVVAEHNDAVKTLVKKAKDEIKPAAKLPAPPKQTSKKPAIQGVENKEPAKQPKADVEPVKAIARTKLIKGSQEARDHMAAIREKRTKSKNVD